MVVANPLIKHKRGDTFIWPATLLSCKCGPAVDITGWSISCEVRDAHMNFVGAADVSITNAAAGQFLILCEETSDWPVGTAHMDIEYHDEMGIKRSTETVTVQILRDITFGGISPRQKA